MRRRAMFFAAAVCLFFGVFGDAPAQLKRTLGFGGLFDPSLGPDARYLAKYSPENGVHVDWVVRNARGDEKINVALMRGSAVLKYLAKDQGCRYQRDNAGNLVGSGSILWTPLPSEVGCDYTFRITTTDNALSNLSYKFKIYPAFVFIKNGIESNARLDSPVGGARLHLEREYEIKYTVITSSWVWPTRKIDFLLLANVNGTLTEVGRIHTAYVIFEGCHIFNSFKWKVGELKSLKDASKKPGSASGIKYRIRLIGDGNQYDSDDFTFIGLPVDLGDSQSTKIKIKR